jgi:hypothetical protein
MWFFWRPSLKWGLLLKCKASISGETVKRQREIRQSKDVISDGVWFSLISSLLRSSEADTALGVFFHVVARGRD